MTQVVGQPDIVIPSNDHDRKAIISEIQAICDEWMKNEASKAAVNDIIANVAESYKLPKETVRALARMHFKRNADEVQAKTDALVGAYEQLYK